MDWKISKEIKPEHVNIMVDRETHAKITELANANKTTRANYIREIVKTIYQQYSKDRSHTTKGKRKTKEVK